MAVVAEWALFNSMLLFNSDGGGGDLGASEINWAEYLAEVWMSCVMSLVAGSVDELQL